MLLNRKDAFIAVAKRLCKLSNTLRIKIATVVVDNPIDAVDDPATTVASGAAVTPAGSVLGNDTLNGNPVTTANTDVTPSTTGPISVDADGNLTVAANTPSGTYTITYELCGNTKYSEKGLRLIAPKLTFLNDLPYTSAELRKEAANRAKKLSIQGV